jgi:hypothetical protein
MAAKKTFGHQPKLAYRSEIFISKSAKDIFSFVYICSLLYNRKDIYRTWLWVKRQLSFKIQDFASTWGMCFLILCDLWFLFFVFSCFSSFCSLCKMLPMLLDWPLFVILFYLPLLIYWQYLLLNLTIYILIMWNAYLWIEDRWTGSISSFFFGQPGDFRRFWMSVNRVLLAFIYNALPLLTTATVHIHFHFCFIIILAKLIDSIFVSDVRQAFYNINSVIR